MRLTHQMLHECASNYAGWNRHQLELLGVKWPPRKGWLSALVDTEINEVTWAKVMSLRRLAPKARRKLLKLEKEPELKI